MTLFIKILWSFVSSIIILLSIYFTFYLKFVQFKFSNYKKCFKKSKNSNIGITPFKTLMLTLAGRIGVGSIAGVSLAIYIGGAGTIFWLWVISIISLPLAFLETTLGSLYKKRIKNEYVGGPSYYIKDGLHNKKLAIVYAILIILSFISGFLGIQVNTITKAFVSIIPVPKIVIGIILMVLTFFIVIGDVFKISEATSKIVPFMLIFYVVLCLFVIIFNVDKLGCVIFSILKSAFSLRPFFSGFLYTMIIGIQRGIFSSETGLGTGSITASASNSLDVVRDGYIQMLGVSITTLVVCTITAFIVLLSPYQEMLLNDINGIEVASFAFGYHFKTWGTILMFIFIFLCSFSTILTGYYDALVSLKFIFKNHLKLQKWFLIFLTLSMILIGSIISSHFMWQIVDLFVGILIMINLYTIFKLKGEVLKKCKI